MKTLSLHILSLLVPFIVSAQTQTSVSGAKINLYGVEETATRLESSPSSPPLETDDPGTPGPHGVEINIILNCDKSKDSRVCEQGIDAAFGIGESLQIRISKALTQDRTNGMPALNGVGTTDLGVKYRFYDKNGLALAVFPSYRFNDATRHSDADGMPIEPDGRSIYLPLIISKDIGDRYTVVVNLAEEKNLDYSDKSAVFSSIAVGKSLNSSTRIMAEIANERSNSFVNRQTTLRVGFVKVLSNPNSRYKVSIFGSLGRTIGFTEDGQPHVKALFGLSVAK